MSRAVTDAFKEAVFAQETSEAFVLLITINHPDLSEPVRVCTSGDNVISRGNTFVAYPVNVELPDDLVDSQPTAQLTIDNVDLTIVRTLRSIRTAPDIILEIVREADPDIVEVKLPQFQLRNVDYDALQIGGQLEVQDLTTEPWPCIHFTPGSFPGLFGG